MQFIDGTCWNRRPRMLSETSWSTAEDLALDEGLLRCVDAARPPFEVLRVWEAARRTVIVGRGSKLAKEVNLAACNEFDVPVLRRCSGGCAIVAGPGCLMYSVVLDLRHRPELRVIDMAHEFVLEKTLQAVKACRMDANVRKAGLSDLVIEAGRSNSKLRKFSGNSLRITRDALLYHGTILYDFPLTSISALLLPPPREPAYRGQREHRHFVTNLAIDPHEFIVALKRAWNASASDEFCPDVDIQQLVAAKYANDRWNRRY